MEVNAKDWMVDLEKQANENSLQIALLKQQVATNHQVVMKNSDVRLAAIMERFDRLEQGGWALWSKLGGVFSIICAAVWFVIIEPIHDRLDAIDRRLMLDADRNRTAIVVESE